MIVVMKPGFTQEELNEVIEAIEKHLFLFEAISTQYLPNVLKIKEKLNEYYKYLNPLRLPLILYNQKQVE